MVTRFTTAVYSFLALTATLSGQQPAPPVPVQRVEMTRVQGTVVDDQDRPVAGATVYCLVWTSQGTSGFLYGKPDQLTDEKGIFSVDVPQLGSTKLILRARHDKAVTEKAFVVTGDKLKESITISISPKSARRYSVRVTDADGKPVMKSKVKVMYSTGGFEQFSDANTRPVPSAGGITDSEGRLESAQCLAPDGSYRLEVQGEEFLSEKTALKEMPKSGALDFGTVVLRRMTPLAGQVLDSNGKPVGGARVTHSDARLRAQATTDDSGKFELKAAFAAPGFLFIEKAGYRFYGQVCDKPEALKITLRRRNEPSGQRITTLPQVMTFAERKALAEQLYAPVLKEAATKNDDERMRAWETLAKLDAGRLLEEMEKRPLQSAWYESYLKRAAAKRIMGESLDEARSIIESMKDPGFRCTGYLDLCDSLPDRKKAEKIEYLNQALLQSKAVTENDHRILNLAQVARRLWVLGEKDRATQLLREGEAIAKELPTAAWAGYARGAFAEDLAPIDLPAALTLMKDLKDPFEFVRHHGNLAVKLAKTNPADAERVFDMQLKPGDHQQVFQRDQRAIRVCYALASVDLQRARKLAESITTSDFKARAYGVMAEAVMKQSPPDALSLLDRSFDILAELVAKGEGRFNNLWSAAGTAGIEIGIAEQIDPALAAEFFWRSIFLFTRSTESDSEFVRFRDRASLGELALVLSRYDRDLAFRLVRESRALSKGMSNSYGRDYTLLALALLDPKSAIASVAEETPGPQRERARGEVIRVLLADGGEVGQFIRRALSMNYTEIED